MSLLSQASIHAFITENGIKTETGKPLDFKVHRYLFDIYRDDSKYLVCLKAGQIGFSTMAILKTLWWAKNRKMNIGYILPTVEMVQKFVGSKVNPIAQQNKIISDWMVDKDSVTQKQIGKNFVHYLGSQTDLSAIMLSLDLLVGDEFDKCPPNILETYDSRLQHSEHGYKWIFSNPTKPEFGVDLFWRLSDQKKWYITHSCGANYVLDESCVDYATETYRCPKCKKEITDEERRMGEWVATSTGKWSGYWIPLWINPMIKASYICEKKKGNAEFFANFVAGLPYSGTGNKVFASTLTNCLSDKVNERKDRIVIGVDTGLPIHYVMCNKQGFFHYGTCSDPSTGKDPYQDLSDLLKRFPSAILISDQGGDLIGIRKLQAQYPGRVFLAWYRADLKNLEISKWGDGEEYGKVLIDRNRAIQWFIDEMTDRKVTFNGTLSEWQEYITHWLNIYRVWEKDDFGMIDKTKGFKWERNGPDHYCHATIYARIGLDKFSEQFAKIVGQDPFEGIPTAQGSSSPAAAILI